MTTVRGLLSILTTAGVLLAAAGCGNSRRDLNGIPNRQPDRTEMYANVDGYPNIVRLCIGGVAFATTTREAAGAIVRVPEWDHSFCGAPTR